MKEFGIEVYGYDPLQTKEAIGGFGVKALDFSFSTNLFLGKNLYQKNYTVS